MITKPIVAGNWKMHMTPQEGYSFVEECRKLLLNIEGVNIIFSPPFTALFNIKSLLNVPSLSLAAQNCHYEDKGAFTGEISISMLEACGVDYVIIGHSERRHVFNEPEEWINAKVKAVLNSKMLPILCIGETLEQRQAGDTEKVLRDQLVAGLADVSAEEMDRIVVAYEPVWAIGTGVTASVDQASEAHQVVRLVLSDLFTDAVARNTAILYGGSVKSDNAAELIQAPGVDGFLIGGASLKVDSFTSIAQLVQENYKEE